MPTVQAPRKLPASPPRTNVILALIGLALVGAMVLVAAAPLEPPERVDGITVANPHAWNARVELTSAAHDGWLGIGAVNRESEQAFDEVIDPGDQWVFRFSYADQYTEVTVDRARLENDSWRVAVPPEFARQLHKAGTAESAS